MTARPNLHTLVTATLLLILSASPLVLASNRPLAWAGWATLIFVLAAATILGHAKKPRKMPSVWREYRVLIILAVLLLGFVALQSAAVFYSVSPRASLLALIRLLSYAVFFGLVIHVTQSTKSRAVFLKAIFLIVFVQCCLALLIHAGIVALPTWLSNTAYPDSVKSTFLNRNSFATYVGFGIFTGIGLIHHHMAAQPLRYHTILDLLDPILVGRLVMVFLMIITLLLTNSRMGTFAVAGAMALVFIWVFAKSNQRKLQFLAGAALILTLLALLGLYGAPLLQRFWTVPDDGLTRMTLYNQVINMISERPWFGFGADGFELGFTGFQQPPLDGNLVWDKAHNSYLGNWAELGLLMGSLPLAMAVYVFGILLGKSSANHRSFAFIGIAILIQSGLHALVDFSLEIQANMFLLLALLASVLSDTHKDVEKRTFLL